MDWMRQGYQAKVDMMPLKQHAEDYLFGFDTGNGFQRWYITDLIANGYVPKDDMKLFVHLSLTRGFDELNQLVSCANTMREKASFDNPFDGQDTLTFISKILQPVSPPGEHFEGHPHDKFITEQSDDRRIKADLGQVIIKHKKGKQSPFWPTPQAEPAKQVSKSANRMKRLDKHKKKEKRKAMVKEKAKKPKAGREYEENGQASVSGSTVLREIPLSFAPAKTEGKEQLQHQQSTSVTLNDTATSMDSSGEGGKSEVRVGVASEEEGKVYKMSRGQNQMPKRTAKSPYFDTEDTFSHKKTPRPPRGTVPCIPFPRLDAPKFGLIQEDLASDPFRLLVAVTFLIRVKGEHAIPVFHELMSRYPTPKDLVEASTDDIVAMVKHLGLASVRAAAIQKYARIWIDNPPQANVRYEVKNYPRHNGTVDIQKGEGDLSNFSSTGPSAWEIGHMTQGRYAIDSWRIFCRDVLLERAEDWRGKGREGEFQPEWMRVLPEDKELRACLRWLWMQEGWAWDPGTGDREVLPENLRKAVDEGRVAYDDAGELKILDKKRNLFI